MKLQDRAVPAVLESARLPADRELLLAHYTKPEVRRWLWDDRVIAFDDVDALIATSERTFAEYGRGMRRLDLRAGGGFAGSAGLVMLAGATAVELLYSLEPACWAAGFATEAGARLLDYGFGELRLARIIARTDAPKQPSERVMQRLGMRFDRRGEQPNGLPLVQYALEREAWWIR